MSKSSSLLKLFQEWQQEQNSSSNFIPDGYLGDDEQCRILFICRESNVNGAVSELSAESYKNFWLKNVVDVKSKDENNYYGNGLSISEKGIQTKFYNYLNTAIQNLINENSELAGCTPADCAYMNINKQGGGSSCRMTALERYAGDYKDFIIKEINILDPTYIVLCGVLWKSKKGITQIKEILRRSDCDASKIYLCKYHPCARRKLNESANITSFGIA